MPLDPCNPIYHKNFRLSVCPPPCVTFVLPPMDFSDLVLFMDFCIFVGVVGDFVVVDLYVYFNFFRHSFGRNFMIQTFCSFLVIIKDFKKKSRIQETLNS